MYVTHIKNLPRYPLALLSWGGIRKYLLKLRVCFFRLIMMVRAWYARSLGRLSLFDFLLRRSALVDGRS
jgi:hypothetical protein